MFTNEEKEGSRSQLSKLLKLFKELLRFMMITSFYKSPLNIGWNNMSFNQLEIVRKEEETV